MQAAPFALQQHQNRIRNGAAFGVCTRLVKEVKTLVSQPLNTIFTPIKFLENAESQYCGFAQRAKDLVINFCAH
jgi:hypothetical protein